MFARLATLVLLGCAAAAFTVVPAVAEASAGSPARVSPLPSSSYGVRSLCAAPGPGRARCMALALVAGDAQARAHRSPIGVTGAAALAPSAAPSPAAGDFGLRPRDLHSAYGLPKSAPEAQTIALVDAYNDPSAEEDLGHYSSEFGLPECTAADGCFSQLNQNGRSGEPPFPRTRAELEAALKGTGPKRTEAREAMGWSVEISLDIETAHAVCESCRIVLVEANNPEYANLEAAEESAARAGAGEISNSWGGPECVAVGDCIADSPAFDHPGVVVAAAAGDEGYLNWLEESVPFANYPATSPHVVAVGGTRLELGAKGEWAGESVWNDGGRGKSGRTDGSGATGGGCSAELEAQPWQRAVADWSEVGCGDRRAVADVAADADPYTGVAVYDTSPECETEYEALHTVHWCTIGGTSLATPLIAASFALAGGAGGVEYPSRTLYENAVKAPASLHDVTSGSNGECDLPFDTLTRAQGCTPAEDAAASCSSELICLAGSGYDGPTGLGTPDGIAAFLPAGTKALLAPSVSSAGASSVSSSSATLSASVDPNGSEVIGCTIEYGPGEAYSASAPCEPMPGSGTSAETVSAKVEGLSPGTEYGFRVRASNAGGRGEALGAPFTTPAAAPTIAGASASHVSQRDATLEARIDPNGAATSWEVLMDDPCAAPMECIRADVVVAGGTLAAGDASVAVRVDLAESAARLNIEPGTTYTFWVRAGNEAGPAETTPQTFTTLAEPGGPPSREPPASQEPGPVSSPQLPTTLSPQTPGQTPSGTPVQSVASLKQAKAPAVAHLASTTLRERAGGTVAVRVSCPGGERSCAGTLTLQTLGAPGGPAAGGAKASPLRLATVAFRVSGTHARTLTLRLSARARALLARARVLRARAIIEVRGASATQATVAIRAGG
ncbi:MAG TPA: fibronectin type III domain-containing protein [Solirubrobacteraceae bacterium]|jgi:hypothetical protein|nr:fibronectin type III domain-containing protein [Solirubrobacteraceae bacterium]